MKKLSMEELQRKSVEEFRTTEKMPLVVVLDNIRSMLNVGSVFRTSDAFLVDKLWLCGITATPPHRDIAKTALGATESVSWEHAADTVALMHQLKSEGYTLLGAEQTDESISLTDFQLDPKAKYAIVFGNEVEGLSEGVLPLLNGCLEIPQAGTKHSLNISVAAGIVIFKFFEGRG